MAIDKTKHPLYSTWQGMKSRCYSPNHRGWPWYGAKGITVCERWHIFRNFEDDMSPKPPGTSLDRINPDKGYSPENCRWATHREQGRNKKDMIVLTIDGKDYIAVELRDISGLKTDTIVERARQGLSYDEVISKKRRKQPKTALRGILERNKKLSEEKFCHVGHEFTDANTIKNGKNRRCRECHRLTVLRYKERKRQERLSML